MDTDEGSDFKSELAQPNGESYSETWLFANCDSRRSHSLLSVSIRVHPWLSRMIVYQSRFLTRGEIWFDDERSQERVDWVLYHQRSQPLSSGSWRPFYTRLIDLRLPVETLSGQLDGFTAADIRKAQKKDLTVCRQLETTSGNALAEFAKFYERFAVLKHIGPVDLYWLERTAQARKLDLWIAANPEGAPLVYHAFYVDEARVRSLYAASLYAELSEKEAQRKIGRANRLLIWESMMHYRNRGVAEYDFGGWYNGTTDQARLGINKFKEAFGGTTVCEYEGEELLTLKAWSVITAARIFQKFGGMTDSRNSSERPAASFGPPLSATR